MYFIVSGIPRHYRRLADGNINSYLGLLEPTQFMNKRHVHQLEVYTDNIVGHIILDVTINDSGKCESLFGLMYTDVGLGTNCTDRGNTRRACKVLNGEENGPVCQVRCDCAMLKCYINVLERKSKSDSDNNKIKVYEMTTANFINYL